MGFTLKLGKQPQSASFVAFIGISLLICLLSMFWSYKTVRNVQNLEQKAQALQAMTVSSQKVREKRNAFLKSHRIAGSDQAFHFSQNFYTEQKQTLGSCFTTSFFSPSSDQKKLHNDLNKQQAILVIDFDEISSDQTKTLLESTKAQRETATIDKKDLIEILQHFEGNNEKAVKPQTIIKDMSLIKNPDNNSFNIKMQILQRNFIK